MGDERFRAMAEALPSMVFEADLQGSNIWSSEAWSRYTGLALAELTGMEWQQVFHSEEQARNRVAWQESIRSGNGFSMPYRIRRHDGRWLRHLVWVVPLHDAAGRIEAWVGSATDIDETQQHVLVHSDWNDGRIPSVVGTWRMEDFGLGYAREMRAGRVVAIADIRLDPRTGAPDGVRAYAGIHTRAILDVPLVKQGRLVAMLFVHHPEPRDWTHAEVDLVEQGRRGNAMAALRRMDGLPAGQRRAHSSG